MKSNLLFIIIIFVLVGGLTATTSRAYYQKLWTSTSEFGELPGVSNSSASSASDYTLSAYVTSRPTENLQTGVDPAECISVYRYGNGTTEPYTSVVYLQLSYFPTQWVANDVIFFHLTYIPSGFFVEWTITIPDNEGTAIGYNQPINPIEQVDCSQLFAIPPSEPQNVSPSQNAHNISPEGVNLVWTASSPIPATGYRVVYGLALPSNVIEVGNVLSYYFSGLGFDTTYHWMIEAYNDNGSSYGSIWTFTTEDWAPEITVSPNALEFGETDIGYTAQKPLAISNTGNAYLEVDSITPTESVFTVSLPAGMNYPLMISSGDSVIVTINFTPLALQVYTADLVFNCDVPGPDESSIPLSGTGSHVPPKIPENVSVVLNDYDACLSWDPVTETIYDTPIVPDGYIVLYSEDDISYWFHGATADTTYTHFQVAEFRNNMFYHVIAYKTYTRAQEVFIEGLVNRKDKVSREEILAKLK